MIDRAILDKEMRELRELFELANALNLKLLDKTMKLHGRHKAFRQEVLAEEEARQLRRMKTCLAECETALIVDGHTLQ
jgi:hypothetical protein